ncbi:outer membrane protein assembly factor BamB [Alkalimarinus sediminis]|uniref:Outer membrane protein assembly factor BamB n=1 Tax=Alkalimarinus sediminis TaxID=1632866 RepID=A0A9E8HJP0_9ALTE|nr:outer membrane protein assembly factor BamB [Alkalimarinus sediminis]UZW75900.1 outer membrane protein assembly factor BamB [Alkalimarinus sediminis]
MHAAHAYKVLLRLFLAASLIVIVGCSSDDDEQEPMELEDFDEEIEVVKVWEESVGDGNADQYLKLEPIIIGNTIYAIDHFGVLAAINTADGEELWEAEFDEPVSGALGGDDNQLYFATYHGEIIAVDRSGGMEQWRVALTSEVLSAPVSNGRQVVVQSIDGKVVSLNAQSGEMMWRYDSNTPVLSLRGTASPVITDEFTVTGFANGELVAFQNITGSPVWNAEVGIPKGRTELERLVDIDGQPVIEDDAVYTISYQGKLSVIHLPTGKEIWSKQQSSYTGVDLGFGNVYVSTSEGVVVAYNQTTRSEVWRQENLKFRQLTTPKAFGSTTVVADFEGYVHFLSQIDGRLVGRVHLDSDGIRSPMIISGDMLFIYSNSGDLAAYKIAL